MKKTYLGNEILAQKNGWVIVFDGKYNYMLFNFHDPTVRYLCKKKRMPRNDSYSRKKMIEYYTTFKNARVNLEKVVKNNGFIKKI
jgi:hypothetical protein